MSSPASPGSVRQMAPPFSSWKALLSRVGSVAANAPWIGNRARLGPTASATIDLNEMASGLAVESRARADGGNEQPATTDEQVSGTEKEIALYFEQLQQRSHNEAMSVAKKVRSLGGKIDLAEAFSVLSDIPARCQNEIRRIRAKFQSQFTFYADRLTHQQESYTSFREAHELHRVAEYPRTRFVHHVFVASLIVAGSLAISHFSAASLSNASSVSPWMAILLSCVSAIVPFVFAATVIRFLNHARGSRRLAAGLGVVLFLAFIAIFSVAVAHFFALLNSGLQPTARTLIDSVWTNAALGHDLTAWMTSGMVMGVAAVSFLIGYKSDDPYPGYGTVQRAFYRAQKDHGLIMKRLRNRINAVIDKAESEVDHLSRPLKTQLRHYSAMVDELRQVVWKVDRDDTVLEEGCNQLLRRYRAANVNARRTDPPNTFTARVSLLPAHESLRSTLNEELERLDKLQTGLSELEAEATKVRLQLKDLNWQALDDLETLGENEPVGPAP